LGPEKKIDSSLTYMTLTFGSLFFMVVVLYLPQVLPLKLPGGLELEKSAAQISSPSSLGITLSSSAP
jgi:hypothetical protein